MQNEFRPHVRLCMRTKMKTLTLSILIITLVSVNVGSSPIDSDIRGQDDDEKMEKLVEALMALQHVQNGQTNNGGGIQDDVDTQDAELDAVSQNNDGGQNDAANQDEGGQNDKDGATSQNDAGPEQDGVGNSDDAKQKDDTDGDTKDKGEDDNEEGAEAGDDEGDNGASAGANQTDKQKALDNLMKAIKEFQDTLGIDDPETPDVEEAQASPEETDPPTPQPEATTESKSDERNDEMLQHVYDLMTLMLEEQQELSQCGSDNEPDREPRETPNCDNYEKRIQNMNKLTTFASQLIQFLKGQDIEDKPEELSDGDELVLKLLLKTVETFIDTRTGEENDAIKMNQLFGLECADKNETCNFFKSCCSSLVCVSGECAECAGEGQVCAVDTECCGDGTCVKSGILKLSGKCTQNVTVLS